MTTTSTQIVSSSNQVPSVLPSFIVENYENFVEFMSEANKSHERLGFGKNILQKLQEYRSFSTYKKHIRQFDFLNSNLPLGGVGNVEGIEVLSTAESYNIITDDIYEIALGDTSVRLELANGDGFPLENGILLIDDEIILYRYRINNVCYDLYRGASATTILPTLNLPGEYKYKTEQTTHIAGSKVFNLSVMFLVSMLDTIHESFVPSFSSERVHPDISRSPLLVNIKDFYQSKGTKLGIKSFFKILFGENDVEVRYPGDQMIKPSESTWIQNRFMRVVPVPKTLCDPSVRYGTPSKLTGSQVIYRSYLDKKEKNIYAKATCNYVSTYMFGDRIQYELALVPDSLEGDFLANPYTVLTRALESELTSTDTGRDVTTVTVESTLGFPDKGLFFIGEEAIFYESKSFNQFFNCTRGYRGVEVQHSKGEKVYGPYFIESSYVEDGEVYVSRSWPLGLVSDIRVDDPGVLHTTDDEVILNGPGRIDYREPILGSFLNRENYADGLARTTEARPSLPYIGNYTWGVSGVYFNQDYVFVASSKLPDYEIGLFSDNDSVGPGLQGEFAVHIIPRRESIQENDELDHKGTGGIGVFVDGVPAYSNVSTERLERGKIIDFTVLNTGKEYLNPTVIMTPDLSTAEATVDPDTGKITAVTSTSEGNYEGVPSVRVTSGENAEIALSFDRYGRVTSASVLNGGQYYKDLPAVKIVDSSNRGKGAVINCTVDGEGVINSVEVNHSGIDYNPSTTQAKVIPVGEDAVVIANIEYYELNRWVSVESAPRLSFDDGNGFLWPDDDGNINKFAYIADPIKLREKLEDNGFQHSPLIGWAFDGNPIYGPIGWRNGENDNNGLVRQKSGYRLQADRAGMIPANGEDVGASPPDDTLPMGAFIQDYKYFPIPLESETIDGNDLLDEYNGKVCNTPEFPKEIYPRGVYCYFITNNADGTPAFPYIIGPTFKNKPISQRINVTDHEVAVPVEFELSQPTATYDDRTIDFDFDYIERYRNPYLQSTSEGIKLEVSSVSDGYVSDIKVLDGAPYNRIVGDYLYFDDTETQGAGAIGKISHIWGKEVDKNVGVREATMTRLISHRQLINLRHYTNIFSIYGTARKIGVIEPGQVPSQELYPPSRLPVRTGDYFIYSDPGTAWNGDGVKLDDWVLAKGYGSDVDWENVRYYVEGELIFIVGNSISTSSGAQAVIESYEEGILIVHTNTPNLIQAGDAFFDARGKTVEILPVLSLGDANRDSQTPTYDLIHRFIATEDSSLYIIDPDILSSLLNEVYVGELSLPDGSPYAISSTSYVSDFFPEDDNNINTGDLWWSEQTGRLYIFYGTGWICTQPIGTRPMIGSLNTGIGTHTPTVQDVYHAQTQRTVTISTMAPDLRSDGGTLIEGDLWWSQHTGILYIYYNRVWVCTDPNGSIPHAPYDAGGREFSFNPDPGSQSVGLKVVVSFKSPDSYSPVIGVDGRKVITLLGSDPSNLMGTDVTVDLKENGTLWWSPAGIGTGMMYIRYDETWCVTNPVGTLSTIYALDTSAPNGGNQYPGLGGGGAEGGGGVWPLPELPEQQTLYFRNTSTFDVGDVIEFKVGAPGVFVNEKAEIVQKLPQDGLFVNRGVKGTKAKEIPDGTKTENFSHFVYVVTTKEPHQLIDGETIRIEGSLFSEINGERVIDKAGRVTLALGEGTVDDGKVTGVTMLQKGGSYPQEVLVEFRGGGGTGARGLAIVNPIDGSIMDVTITEPGGGYIGPPTAVFSDELPNNKFYFFTNVLYKQDTLIKYSVTKPEYQGEAAYADTVSGGIGYRYLPNIVGSYPVAADQADVSIQQAPLNNLSILQDNVNVTRGGSRYVNPTIIFYDEDASGFGAEGVVNVTNGEVTGVTVTNGGEGYVIPRALIVEQDGNYIPLTDTIGQIKSLKVIDPGRELSANRAVKPEILITTRLVVIDVLDEEGDVAEWIPGFRVYQGSEDMHLVEAEIVDYQKENQILVLKNVDGVLKDDEMIYQEQTSTKGLVVLEGQADCSIVIDAESTKIGLFYDDSSKVSEEFAVIQDSYYYQWFSYVVASPLPQIKYDSFLKQIIHPAGFALFSDLMIKEEVFANVTPQDFVNELVDSIVVMGPDGYRSDAKVGTALGSEFSEMLSISVDEDHLLSLTEDQEEEAGEGDPDADVPEVAPTTPTPVSVELEALDIERYYPLYTTPEAANEAGDGTHHIHYFEGVAYYMPNGLTMGVDMFHGTYGLTP